MEVTPQENLEFWQAVRAKAMLGAQAAATAMAAMVAWRAKEITLRQTTHPPGAWNWQQPGQPPAYGSGQLSRGMFYTPASSGLRATALTGNKAPYSRILEYGCFVTPVYKKRMAWSDSGGTWYHELLEVQEHPFLWPTVSDSIDDGSLQEAAIEGFGTEEGFRVYDP